MRTPHGAGSDQPGEAAGSDHLDAEISAAMGELLENVITRIEQLGQSVGIPSFCVKALEALESPMAMRDLGKVMHCDPSFVTSIADLLEKRGLARREASTVDRRIKNIVLTGDGLRLRDQLHREFMARVPWHCLDNSERACLLALVRKMIRGEGGADPGTTPPSTTGGQRAGEVNETLITTQPGG
jgi:MarR family transcriptional regulator, organic hydroperoxide resistance regulator